MPDLIKEAEIYQDQGMEIEHSKSPNNVQDFILQDFNLDQEIDEDLSFLQKNPNNEHQNFFDLDDIPDNPGDDSFFLLNNRLDFFDQISLDFLPDFVNKDLRYNFDKEGDDSNKPNSNLSKPRISKLDKSESLDRPK